MKNKPVYITFEELGIVMCKADTKRKILNPIWDKMHLESVQIFYKIGYVFRDKNKSKKYYSEEEVKEKIIDKLNEYL
ncbi:hypothetical protein [Clostridium saccharoperbutylacetonicum]|uniref:hypothetical protein n=1 Tax=Clostridium saccharoperbutylacetonicum TaxID=36745 RepID=UPI0039EC08E2